MSDKHPAHKSHNGAVPEDRAESADPFRAVGSLRLLVSDEEFETRFLARRRRQAELFEAKMRSIFE